jgi:hypothetical protein
MARADRYLVTPSNVSRWTLRIGQFLADGRLTEKPTRLLGMYVKVTGGEKVEIENPRQVVNPVCPKCGGDQHYVVEGIDKGPCWDCEGKGFQVLADVLRDRSYHSYQTATKTTTDTEPPAE